MAFSQPINKAGRILRSGGVVAYPTEGVYGLGCLPGSALAVQRLLQIKSRSADAGLIVIAAELEQLEDWIQPDRKEARRLRGKPKRATTWIVSARPDTPSWLTGGRDTLAVRVTTHPVAAALCREADTALVSTSANVSGRPPALTALGVRRRFGTALDCVLAGAVGPDRGSATEIRRAQNNALLRPGK